MRMVPSGVTTTSQGMNFVGGFSRPSISIGGGNLRTIVPSAVDGDEKFFALPLEKFESMTSDQSLPEAADKGAVLVEDQEGVGGLIGDEKNPGQDVGERFLGREADGNSDDARAGEEGRDLDLVNLENDEEEGKAEDHEVEAPDEIDQAIVEVVVGRARQFVQCADENEADEEVDEKGPRHFDAGLFPRRKSSPPFGKGGRFAGC